MTDISGPLLLAAAVILPELLRKLNVSGNVIRVLGALIAVASVAMLVNLSATRPGFSEAYGSPIEISLWVLVLVGSFWQMMPHRSPTSEPKTG